MKLTDIRNSINEISAIGGLKMVVKGNTKEVEGIKLSKEMAQAMIDWFNSSPYGRKYPKAAKARLHISLGIMSVMGLDRYAKHKGAKEELKYIKDLSKAMRDNVNESALNESADESLTDKEQELVRKSLQRAAGVRVDTDVTDLRYNTGTSEFIFDGGEEMMLYVGYDEDDEEYNVSIESFDDGQIAQKNTKDLKSAIKVAMQMAKKYKKRLTSESVNEGKNHKSKDSRGVRFAEAVYNNVSAIVKAVEREKMDVDRVVNSFGPVLVNAIKTTLKHKFKPTAGNEDKLDDFYDELKELLKVAESLVKRPSKSGVTKLDASHRTWWNHNGGADVVLNGKYADNIVESLNEAKYDIGMARKGKGLTVYNKAEEENGDYKNVAHIDNKGKIKYYDKKIPSKIKKQIEAEAKKMMEITKEETTMKLKDLLNESFEGMRIQASPSYNRISMREDDRTEESSEMTTEQKQAFLEAVKAYKTFGESVYRKEGLSKVYESIRGLVEVAGKNMVKETEGSFDGITVGRHVKRMNESFKIFEKTLREVSTLQQRLESSYDEIGETLGKYYEINELEEKDLEEGNEFGAARTKAIANGDSEFEVDGKKYPVKDVSKDDKDNAKEFTKENTKGTMKLKDLLKESFGFGELPSSKLIKMKVSAKDMLASVNNKKINESDEVEEEKINEGGFATWEMSFADMTLSGVKLSKKKVYKVKARNTVEAIKKAAKMAGVGDSWIATQTHSLKKIG